MADLTGVKLKGSKNGKEVLFDPSDLGTNVVITNVPCLGSVYVGSAVIMNGGGTAENGLADSLANSNIIGVVEAKPTGTTCNIRVIGVTLSVLAGLDVTKEYYLSDTVAGQLTTSIPTASGTVILRVGQPFSATEFMVNKGQRTVRV